MSLPVAPIAGATIGVDLGGTKALAVAVVDGTVVGRAHSATGRDLGPRPAAELIGHLVEELTEGDGEHRDPLATAPVGVGFPGLVTPGAGIVRSSVILDGWREVRFADRLREHLGRPVCVDNDVHTAAVAELHVRRSDGDPVTDLLVVTAGTGIGGAVVIDGRVRPGASGSAGEVGHLAVPPGAHPEPPGRCECGGTGCLHLRASGRAIEQALGAPPGTLADLVQAGDRAATERLRTAAHDLGRVLVDAMHLLDLPLVAIGGGLSRWAPFVPEVQASFRDHAMVEVAQACRIEPLRAGYDAGALGAALSAMATLCAG